MGDAEDLQMPKKPDEKSPDVKPIKAEDIQMPKKKPDAKPSDQKPVKDERMPKKSDPQQSPTKPSPSVKVEVQETKKDQVQPPDKTQFSEKQTFDDSQQIRKVETVPVDKDLSSKKTSRSQVNAYVTIATDDTYAASALVLGSSLRNVKTEYKLVILITTDVSESIRQKLENVFDEIGYVNILESCDQTNLSLMNRPELGKTFTKLHIWQLVHYSKCVFLDADTLVLKNCDELFEKEELSAVPDVGWPDCFNSGVFVFSPSIKTFNNLIELAQKKGSFDGGDQGLLNSYFNDWSTKDIERHLSFIYNMVASSSYTYLPAYKQFGSNVKIVHFLGSMKPWHHDHRDESRNFRSCNVCQFSADNLMLWWNLYANCVEKTFPKKKELEDVSCTPESNTVTTSINSDNSADSNPNYKPASKPASSESTRRQRSWEQGQIDYLGQDAFINIQRKLEESINNKNVKE